MDCEIEIEIDGMICVVIENVNVWIYEENENDDA